MQLTRPRRYRAAGPRSSPCRPVISSRPAAPLTSARPTIADAAGATQAPRATQVPPRASQVTSLLKPVCSTMGIVVYLLHTLDARETPSGGFSQLMVYAEKEGDDASTVAGGVLLNGLVMVRAKRERAVAGSCPCPRPRPLMRPLLRPRRAV